MLIINERDLLAVETKVLLFCGWQNLNIKRIAHFRVAACLSFKASPGAQLSNGNELRILMQIKLISLSIVEHQDSLRNRDKQQLGNGLFFINSEYRCRWFSRDVIAAILVNENKKKILFSFCFFVRQNLYITPLSLQFQEIG